MSLLEVISDLSTDTVTLTRPGTTTRTLGRPTVGAASTIPDVVICLQPPNGRLLKTQADGQRGDDTRVFYTETVVRLKDTLPIAGETFEVFHVAPWELEDETFYVVKCSRRVLP